MAAGLRAERAEAADRLCAQSFTSAWPGAGLMELSGQPRSGVALVAVGGYGRRELAPYSDLDVVLLHDDHIDVCDAASQIWYPLWDAGVKLDHSVRAVGDLTSAAAADPRVALGLIDLRPLAGDLNLVLRVRSTVLADWRRQVRSQLPELKALMEARHRRFGELAHQAVPDLKESAGGLRDATVLKALVASWLVDVPHTELERARSRLLDARDALQEVAGRRTDRVLPEYWSDLADALGLPDREAAQREVRTAARRLTHLSRMTWRRLDGVLAEPVSRRGRPRRPELTQVAPGLAITAGEIVLDGRREPADDPLLLLRAAAEAAERGVVLSPAGVARMLAESPPLGETWPDAARQLLIRLLAAGPGLVPVWETLEETGALARLLPEWESIELLPHASVIHQFTVDRHVIETCVRAGALIRQTARPDVLLLAALLHDIGKGVEGEHCQAGEPIARVVSSRLGFSPADTALVCGLVRHHLLLATLATTRDPDDPATVQEVSSRVGSVELLELLALLTQADAQATSAQAWTDWRAGLVARLVRNASAVLEPSRHRGVVQQLPPVVPTPMTGISIDVRRDDRGSVVTVTAPDRVGLLADVAAVLGLARLPVRAARAWTVDGFGRSQWSVDEGPVDPALLRERFEAISQGRIDPAARLRICSGSGSGPMVSVLDAASATSVVLEVRAADGPGLLYGVLKTLAKLDLTVRSAHIDTLGPQAVDVFYLQERSGGAPTAQRAAEAADAVRAVLVDGVKVP